MLSIFTTGLVTGLALIAAVGAQAAFVLRQGIRREHTGLVVGICILADVFLIAVGIGGVGAFISGNDTLLATLTYGGAAYLLFYAYTSFRSALKPSAIGALNGVHGQQAGQVANEGRTASAVALSTLAITFLNPHVYLDTVLMLGNIAHQFEGDGPWIFGAGAIVASVLWFLGIGFGAKKMAPILARPRVWQGIDLAVGALMVAIAAKLVFSH